MAGASYSRQHNATFSKDGPMDSDQLGIFNNSWDGSVAEPEWSDWYQNADDIVRQKSAYTAARLSLADPLSLIVGARYTQYSSDGSSGDMRKYNTTPYGGMTSTTAFPLTPAIPQFLPRKPNARKRVHGSLPSPVKIMKPA